ncbi:hypothetical protein QQ020_24585 [Fulvivirgaceae bacterium BMA12]|uniref:Uncharacterized protein n=1 Tax=Agaribacillus aureus TaxID=3051825 RepID=A0ABT8LBX0_9BACT|nr:hypothetical protein [Fulvivirgaceae bacterium BMA12]
MIRPLRKRHRIMWLALLPVISILFVKSFPSFKTYREKETKAQVPDSPTFMETVSTEKPYFDARLGTLSSGEQVLQMNLKTAFDSPAPGVYLVGGNREDVKAYQFLGDVNTTGNHQFKFEKPNDSYQLIVYDPIKKIQLETINFQ